MDNPSNGENGDFPKAPTPVDLEAYLATLEARLVDPRPPDSGHEPVSGLAINSGPDISSELATRSGPAIRVGLDLGTASIVLVVLDRNGAPLGLARQEASVVRDGLVVDFAGARIICQRLRESLEQRLGIPLNRAALAVPPGTSERDQATHGYVSQAAGLEVDRFYDEPVAANLLLAIKDGALADLGGGTTGAAAFKDGEMIVSFDEPTGGLHLSLVIAGNLKIPLEQAENYKRDPKNRQTVSPLVAPVLSKMGYILHKGLKDFEVPVLWLAGGSAAAPGAGEIIARETGLKVKVAPRPELVTPAGIALGCAPYVPDLNQRVGFG